MSDTVKDRFNRLREQALKKEEKLKEQPVIRIGTASCGVAAGALKTREAFQKLLQERGLPARVMEVGCLGHCYAEPLVIISKPGFPSFCYGSVDEGLAERLVEDFLLKDDPCYEYALAALDRNEIFPTFEDFPRGVYEQKIILEHCGLIDPLDIDHYIARDGYAALASALEMGAEKILQEVRESGLRGRGGAGFPAAVKWEACRRAGRGEKYVICNGDEGDPGAFMDRNVLESNPHQVIEGMIIAALAIGAAAGYLYIRAEYPQAVAVVREALRQAREKNLLGKSILGSGFDFDLEIFQGSGAFVCGEATALVKSMEGFMGEPESRPPRLSESGFRGKPTLLNNVKTFAYVPPIIRRGASWFRGIGTEGSPGTAVFSLVGKVAHTGLVEVPMGTTLRQLIFDVGEGVPGGKKFKAVQIGGPSGGCLPEEALDIPIDFDSLNEAGAIMGSGGLVVLDEEDCMVGVARYFLEFTQQESCGKCTFCRLGTKQMLELLTAITRGEGRMEDLEILQELGEEIQMGSLCNLGKTAPNPVLTTLRYFREEYEAHILERCCPARSCSELIVYYIEPSRCTKLCNVCVGSCPTEAIYTREDGLKAINQEKCVKCDNCRKCCPPEYNAVVKLSPPELPAEKEAGR
ncbi:MAG TPA: NADH-ubiquinone oxidoreductase-F iron-sulfur binding region domain-containing protein [Bacillota bacterium]|jgi:NADH-quinone oxidoreductase subunit F|nr:NADH-quinone oxidoreductase subunit F [Bacillota bacterium]HOB86693.1 NADH-ubiquinone oxidoreductase-F iron-sulfur binding region domain-containing protein [Bacillota bacterium]HOP69029.1 NADH-ubiquinone oxidoreductase-F iron-sulfur binding region domain-containing protein [Bacillota bacterium]HPT33661.1 NADH-ubiquinone oxidoreductase-F iron-sulfur binding region domain-containing protein [Bacillota bacterium]